MRNFFLAAAAVAFALIATPVPPANAGSYGHHDYDHDDYYTYEAPPLVVYKSYLPDEDDFGPIPRHYYVKRYVHRYYYREPSYRYYSDYRHDSGDCGWLKRRAKHTDSRYWWKRYHDCVD